MKLSVFQDNQLINNIDLEEDGIAVDGAEFFIGRSKDCHISFNNQQISRQHAVITKRMGSKWEIKKTSDLSSLIINGQIHESKLLENGDIINIGPFALHLFIKEQQIPTTAINSTTNIVDIVDQNSFSQTNTNNVSANVSTLNPVNTVNVANAVNTNINPNSNLSTIESSTSLKEGREEGSNVAIEAGSEVGVEDSSLENEIAKEELSEENATSEDDPFAEVSSTADNSSSDASSLSERDSNSSNAINESSDINNNSTDSTQDNNTEGTNADAENPSAEDEEGGGSTKIFTSFAEYILKILGEYAPYDSYAIKDKETFIGRDPKKCQIVLNDTEVSSVHAVIKKNAVDITLEDLNSANGTILNGSRINEASLGPSDEFIIGSTTFTLLVKSEILNAEADRLMPVAENQEIQVEEVVEEEVNFSEAEASGIAGTDGNVTGDPATMGVPSTESGGIKGILKDPKKRLIFGLAAIVVGYLLFGMDDSPSPDKKDGQKKENQKQDPSVIGDPTKASTSGTTNGDKSKDDKDAKAVKTKKKLTPEEKDYLEGQYNLAKSYYDKGMYNEAKKEIDKIFEISEDGYKGAGQLRKLIKEGYEQIAELEKRKQKELETEIKKKKIEDLLKKTNDAVKEHRSEIAEALFNQILEIDPEQADVPQLRLEMNAWKKEQERIAVEKEQKIAERNRKVQALSEGKNYYLKNKWNLAIDRLEKFLQLKDMDEDLIKDATEMLNNSKNQIKNRVEPLLGKARSLKEGQDLKGAYESYLEILKVDPALAEAHNEINDIKDTLDMRARKIFREAIISESLGLYDEAKEKLREVLQIAPTDSVYFNKSRDKLKNYPDFSIETGNSTGSASAGSGPGGGGATGGTGK
ncbi:MAG: FHA domain-containing protein [Oligoflexia bacterium]|nr:FHA domain-containing protein [Oligoflexia bacterium]